MNNRNYVSIDISKLLVEKGYNINTDSYYVESTGSVLIYLPRPTLYEVLLWLIEIHGLYISVRIFPDYDEDFNIIHGNVLWTYSIYGTMNLYRIEDSEDEYNSYQEALSSGIYKALSFI